MQIVHILLTYCAFEGDILQKPNLNVNHLQ